MVTDTDTLQDFTDLQDERDDLRRQLDEANDTISDLRTELDTQVESNLLTINQHARAMWLANDSSSKWHEAYMNQCDITGRALKSRQEWIDYGQGLRSFVIPNIIIILVLMFMVGTFAFQFAKPLGDGPATVGKVLEWITWP